MFSKMPFLKKAVQKPFRSLKIGVNLSPCTQQNISTDIKVWFPVMWNMQNVPVCICNYVKYRCRRSRPEESNQDTSAVTFP